MTRPCRDIGEQDRAWRAVEKEKAMQRRQIIRIAGYAAMIMLGLLFLPASVQAHEHHEFHEHGRGGLFLGGGVGPYYEGGGYYEDQVQSVLVEPGHYAKQWIPPQTETTYDINGNPVVREIRPGFYQDVWIEPRYEQRVVRVWVSAPGPRVGVGFGFHF
jgi:hypothetical protein